MQDDIHDSNIQSEAAAWPKHERENWPVPDLTWLQPTTSTACPFPTDLLPQQLGKMATSFASARQVPVDFVVTAILGGSAAAVGNRLRLRTFEGTAEPLSLFLALVSPPASGKSRALQIVEEPLARIENALVEAHKAARMEKGRLGQLSTLASALQASVATRLAMEGIDGAQDDSDEGNHPPPPSLLITDWTVAGLIQELEHGIEGRSIIADELTGALAPTMGPSGLKSRSIILMGFDGKPYRKRTASGGRVTVPSLHLPVLGATQPARVSALVGNTRDGLTSRFLWSAPEIDMPTDLATSSGPDQELEGLFTRLVQIEPTRIQACYSHQVPLAENARGPLQDAMARWRNMQRKSDGAFIDILARALQQALRVSTLVAQIEHALAGNDGPVSEVAAVDVERGIALIDNYFLPMAENVLSLAQRPADSDAYKLAKYFCRLGKAVVSIRDDVYRGRGCPVRDKTRVAAALEELRQRRIIHDAASAIGALGRPSFAVEINKYLLVTGVFDR